MSAVKQYRKRRCFEVEEKRAIYERDGGKCVYCGAPAQEIDHVIPAVWGGKTKKLNRRSIGIEIEEKYCEIAANRCRQEVMELGV